MKNPTGSGLERGVNCPASYALHQAPSTGEAAIKGTENHDEIENGISNGDISKLPEVVQTALKDAIIVDVEVAFALDVETEEVRLIGRRMGRNYGSLAETEIALTIDAIVTSPGAPLDVVTVWDWKSRKRVTPAIRNLQIRAGAVVVMKHFKLQEVRGAIGYLDDADVDMAVFDEFDCALFFAEMRSMLNRIGAARTLVATGGTPEVHAGPWCDYCPAVAYCPAQTRLARTMLGELTTVEQQVAFMTAEDAGRAWSLLKQIQSLADKVEASLKLRAKQDVVPLPNGKRLALVDSSRANFDKKKAIAWIAEHGGNPKDFEGRTFFDTVREINMPEKKAG